MIVYTFKGGYDRNFCYLVVADNKQCLLIDPFEDEQIDEIIDKDRLDLKYIINTHDHFDHIQGNDYYKKQYHAKIVAHFHAKIQTDIKVKHHDSLPFGNTPLKFIYTPGHTKDAMCILIDDKIFTGDTLFVGKVGGTMTEAAAKEEFESLKRLMELPDETMVYPGHDYGEAKFSTIGREKETNPFLQRKIFNNFYHLKQHWTQFKSEQGIK